MTSNPMRGKAKINRLMRLIPRTWRRPRLAMAGTKSVTTSCTILPFVNLPRCRSWPDSHWHGMAPKGYFSVYVGPDRTRFVIKTDSVNHPLFRMLLEDAEKEYGFDFAGPLTLPCDVSVFCKILYTMNTDYDGEDSLNGDDACLELLNDRALDILN